MNDNWQCKSKCMSSLDRYIADLEKVDGKTLRTEEKLLSKLKETIHSAQAYEAAMSELTNQLTTADYNTTLNMMEQLDMAYDILFDLLSRELKCLFTEYKGETQCFINMMRRSRGLFEKCLKCDQQPLKDTLHGGE